MSAPMTAEEIRKFVGERLEAGCGIQDHTIAIANGLLMALWNLSAREREHAELRERVAALEAKVMGDGR